MLDALFTTFFGSQSSRSHQPVAALVGFVLLSILALNAAGKAGLGIAGVIVFFLLFLIAGLLGWLWLSAAHNFFANCSADEAVLRIVCARSYWEYGH